MVRSLQISGITVSEKPAGLILQGTDSEGKMAVGWLCFSLDPVTDVEGITRF